MPAAAGEAMARDQPLHLVVSLGAMLVASLATAATSVTFYFDDQNRFEREIAPGDVHPYVITLKVGEFVRFVAQPKDVNIALAFESPSGTRVSTIDQLDTSSDPETLSATVDGRYRLLVTISPKWMNRGAYDIRLDERRPAVPRDADRIEAERLLTEGEGIRTRQTAESFQAAEELYTRAFRLWRGLNGDAGASDAMNNVGYVRILLGKPREALDAFFQALVLRDCSADRRAAAIFINIVQALQDLGQDRKAIAFSEAALRDPNTNVRAQAISVYTIGQAYSKLGEEKTALQYYLRTEPLAKLSGDRLGEARTLNRAAGSYAALGQWREALLYYGRSLKLRRDSGDRRGEALTLANVGSLYENWGDNERALNHYQKALALSRETRDIRMQAVTLHRIGSIHQILGDPEKAIQYYEPALKLYREARYRSDEAMALLGLGKAHAAKQEFAAALRYYSEAIATSRDRLQRALILSATADAQSRAGSLDDAIASANEAIDIFRAAGNQQGEAEVVFIRARSHESAGRLADARRDLERSLQVIERLRGNIGTLESRALFLASYSDISKRYIRVLMRLGFDALALQASERARARTLADYLSGASVKKERPDQRALLERQREIRALLSAKAEAQLKAMGSKNSTEGL